MGFQLSTRLTTFGAAVGRAAVGSRNAVAAEATSAILRFALPQYWSKSSRKPLGCKGAEGQDIQKKNEETGFKTKKKKRGGKVVGCLKLHKGKLQRKTDPESSRRLESKKRTRRTSRNSHKVQQGKFSGL